MKQIKKKVLTLLFTSLCLMTFPVLCPAGPYAPKAGDENSTAVSMNDASIVAWATGWENYVPGTEMSAEWQTPEKALGAAVGDSYDIVSLGRGGQVTLTFTPPIGNREGYDFAVFENSFSDTYLELAYVEVSSDGIHFLRFDNDSLTSGPVPGFGSLDPTDVDGLAGKYKQGYGTPFDLEDLTGKSLVGDGTVKLNRITHVRVIDVVGDGSCTDTGGDVIYDPYPTVGSAGFDLEAVGVINQGFDNLQPPDQPELVSPVHTTVNVPLKPTFKTGAFSDPDELYGDTHGKTQWQISSKLFTDPDYADTYLVLDITSTTNLTTLDLMAPLFDPDTSYYWRVRYYDAGGKASVWSDVFRFTTTSVTGDAGTPGVGGTSNGIPDTQDLDSLLDDVDQNNLSDIHEMDDHFKALRTVVGSNGRVGLKSPDTVDIKYMESIDPEDIADNDSRPDLMSIGMVTFRLNVPNPGDSVTITIYLSEAAPAGYGWVKYDYGTGWKTYAAATFHANRRSLTLTLTDGGEGDADGIANGVIIDPGGVGFFQSNNTQGGGTGGTTGSYPGVASSSGGQAGFGGGGGCFIGTIL